MNVNEWLRLIAGALVLASLSLVPAPLEAQTGSNPSAPASRPRPRPWKFALSGDSRNCGDVVMPAIAAGVKQSGAIFYWHLGDFRKIGSVDEDIAHQPERLSAPLALPDYQALAWKDFLDSQIAPFGALRVYLGIGNHETIPPKTQAEFLVQFARWIDAPNLRAQRLQDDPTDRQAKTYYHWAAGGVDFINLDNSLQDQFDPQQIAWLEKTLASDSASSRIRAIVVGMHEALPESISKDHSMNQSPGGTETGRRVYADLLQAQNTAHKHVYVLASHSHFFMDGIFNTSYWRLHGGVLPGWIVGAAGAERYALPPDASSAHAAQTNVYGFLTGAVHPDGQIDFDFQQLNESDVPAAVTERYTPEFVHWCFSQNSRAQ